VSFEATASHCNKHLRASHRFRWLLGAAVAAVAAEANDHTWRSVLTANAWFSKNLTLSGHLDQEP
jgi:hypothetical protein